MAWKLCDECSLKYPGIPDELCGGCLQNHLQESAVSPLARVYGDLTIGKGCRIDDFVIITGRVTLGNYVHIGAYSYLGGANGITIGSYGGCSMRVSFFSSSDDHASGLSLVGPCVSAKYKPTIKKGSIHLGRHAHIGAHTVVLPGVDIGDGTVIGANSLILKDLDPWSVYAGTPAGLMRARPQDTILELEEQHKKEMNRGQNNV